MLSLELKEINIILDLVIKKKLLRRCDQNIYTFLCKLIYNYYIYYSI